MRIFNDNLITAGMDGFMKTFKLSETAKPVCIHTYEPRKNCSITSLELTVSISQGKASNLALIGFQDGTVIIKGMG